MTTNQHQVGSNDPTSLSGHCRRRAKNLLSSRKDLEMPAEPLVTMLNTIYLLLMGLVSVVGTATLLKLISEFLHAENRRPNISELEVEDA